MGQRLTVTLREVGTPLAELIDAIEALKDETGASFYAAELLSDAPNSLGLSLANEQVDEARIETGKWGGATASTSARNSTPVILILVGFLSFAVQALRPALSGDMVCWTWPPRCRPSSGMRQPRPHGRDPLWRCDTRAGDSR